MEYAILILKLFQQMVHYLLVLCTQPWLRKWEINKGAWTDSSLSFAVYDRTQVRGQGTGRETGGKGELWLTGLVNLARINNINMLTD